MPSKSEPKKKRPPAEAREPIVRVEDFMAAYEGTVILERVNFEVYPGEVFVILGGSGCGKSTLLKHMIGLYEPAAGRIVFGDQDLTSSVGEHRRRLLQQFGVMYQNGALFGSLTLLENVKIPLEEFTDLEREHMDWIARMKLDLVGLLDFENHLPNEISGGMQKRAAIARAMALDPRILFLDEPSAGLDPITSAELDELIVSISRTLDVTFVVVTHELPSIYTIADRVIMLDKISKGIMATGDPRDLRDNSRSPWVRQFLNRQVTPSGKPRS